jgi:hypothetical protein
MRLDLDTLRRVTVSGTTAHARPELAGTVVEDRLVPFRTPTTSEPRVNGVLQERIVRSRDDDTLAFYYRITELSGGEIGYGISLRFWPRLGAVDVDYRHDGLGVVGPQQGYCGPEPIQFEFNAPSPRPITPAALSRFMFVKMFPETVPGVTPVTGYDTGGQIIIADVRWAVILPNSFKPTI